VVTVDSAPEDSHGLLTWTILFINIYAVNVIESEEAEFCPVNHFPPSYQICYCHHNLI